VGTSDYDGDTRSDVLWRQPSTGAMAVWYMAGPTVLGTYVFGGPGPAWRAVRVDDFNGDGRGDVLWRETGTGATYLWLMNGTQVIGGTGYTSGQADARWAIETTGDFDGDGRADILWRNAGGPDTGALFVWLMDGTSIKGATYLDPISIDWQVQGLGDYNGDGKSDILWRNVNPGAVDAGRFYIWMMNGPAVIAGTGYTSPQADLSWRVEAPRK
jgi:hypothetical protein